MKVLFITNSYLSDNNGGIYATKAYINAFALLSESITVVYAKKDGNAPTDILEDKVMMVPIEDKRSMPRKFIDLCFGIVNRFQKSIFKYIDPKEYETVVFNNSDVSSRVIKKFKELGLRTITIHHNYQIEYLRGDCSAITMVPTLFWTYIYERQAVKYSDINLTLTNEDVNLLTQHYGTSRYGVIGVFEFKSFQKKAYTNEPRGHRYVITGWLGSKQTEDSLIPWIKTYYPILKEVDPLAELTIAGKAPSVTLCSLAKANGIDVIASPIEMQPILDMADYYICPTDRGGGLKLRNMDGLKSGLPVLTHIVSARGYEFMQKKGVIQTYYDPDTFRNGIRNLLSCKKSKMDILQDYRDYYSLEGGTKRLKSILSVVNIK